MRRIMYGCVFVAYWQSYCLHVALWDDKNVILVVNTKMCYDHYEESKAFTLDWACINITKSN